MKKYKLTTQDLTTYNGFKWEIGKKYTTSGEGGLCSEGFLHYYHHPLLAVLLNPIHGDYKNPKLFEVEAEGIHLDDYGLKGGCTEMTLVKEIELPVITDSQRVAFGILCALEVSTDTRFIAWGNKWLSGEDRSKESARKMYYELGAYAAEAAAARAAGEVARAWEVARAAAEAAAEVARAWAVARAAAEAAAGARARAAVVDKNLDLISLAEKCLKYV